MTVTSADRAAEMNRLVVEQGRAARSMKYGWRPTEQEQQDLNRKAERMHELAELLDFGTSEKPVGRYLNERVDAWLKANPLVLTAGDLADAAERLGRDVGIFVVVGELGSGGYSYQAKRDDLTDPSRTMAAIQVPEGVAEHFRQQGRRQLQRELASLLALESRL